MYEVISKGDYYQYSSGVCNQPDNFKQCLNCHEIMVAAQSICGIYSENPSFEYLREWVMDHQYRGFTGRDFLIGMANNMNVSAASLNKPIKIKEEVIKQ
jgi:hypothetical protein